jgi:hypothetical protein
MTSYTGIVSSDRLLSLNTGIMITRVHIQVYEILLDLRDKSTSARLLCAGHASGELWAASPIMLYPVNATDARQSGEASSHRSGDNEERHAPANASPHADIGNHMGSFVSFGDDGVLRVWNAVRHATCACSVVRGRDGARLGGRAVAAQVIPMEGFGAKGSDDGVSDYPSRDEAQSQNEGADTAQDGGALPVIEVITCLADGAVAILRVQGQEGEALDFFGARKMLACWSRSNVPTGIFETFESSMPQYFGIKGYFRKAQLDGLK